MEAKPTFRPYILSALIMTITGWGGIAILLNASLPEIWPRWSLYFLLVVFFTYFYTAFQFRPDQTADYLRKNGGFIPGIRPGKPTEEFLGRVTNRITLGGALFLGFIAVLPYIVTAFIPGTGALQLGVRAGRDFFRWHGGDGVDGEAAG